MAAHHHCDKKAWGELVDTYLGVLKLFLVSDRFVLPAAFACIHVSLTPQGQAMVLSATHVPAGTYPPGPAVPPCNDLTTTCSLAMPYCPRAWTTALQNVTGAQPLCCYCPTAACLQVRDDKASRSITHHLLTASEPSELHTASR